MAAEALVVRTSDRAQAGPHAFGGSAGAPVGRGADTLPLMTLAQAHALLPGSTLVGDGTTPILRVHTDTRSLARGDLFVALRGERFDAHAFLPQAVTAGAAAALAEHGLVEVGLPGLLVPDALAALRAGDETLLRPETGPAPALHGVRLDTPAGRPIVAQADLTIDRGREGRLALEELAVGATTLADIWAGKGGDWEEKVELHSQIYDRMVALATRSKTTVTEMFPGWSKNPPPVVAGATP